MKKDDIISANEKSIIELLNIDLRRLRDSGISRYHLSQYRAVKNWLTKIHLLPFSLRPKKARY
jgi:hypothetical protein